MKGVAAALNYKNSASVANRIRALKKKFDLQLGCTAAAGDGATSSVPSTPRKGAGANRGPVKTTADSGDGSETEDKAAKSGSGAGAKKARTPRKRAAKSSTKVKDSTDEDEHDDQQEEKEEEA